VILFPASLCDLFLFWFAVAPCSSPFFLRICFPVRASAQSLSPRRSSNRTAQVSTFLIPPILLGSLPCSILFSCARLFLVRALAHFRTQASIYALGFLCQIRLPVLFIAHDFLLGRSSAKSAYSPRDFCSREELAPDAGFSVPRFSVPSLNPLDSVPYSRGSSFTSRTPG
jgi:hypothetical protein